MKQYERLQLKFEQAAVAACAATSRRRVKYWNNVVRKIIGKKPTKQILQEREELKKQLESVL